MNNWRSQGFYKASSRRGAIGSIKTMYGNEGVGSDIKPEYGAQIMSASHTGHSIEVAVAGLYQATLGPEAIAAMKYRDICYGITCNIITKKHSTHAVSSTGSQAIEFAIGSLNEASFGESAISRSKMNKIRIDI